MLSPSVGEGDVDGQPVVVQPAAVGGIADIDVLGCALHGLPHHGLDGHWPRRIVDLERQVGADGAQYALRAMQGPGGAGMEIGRVQIGIENVAGEIVGACIHQAHKDGGVDVGYLHHALPLH